MKHKSSTELQARAWRARLGDLFELEARWYVSRAHKSSGSKLGYAKKILRILTLMTKIFLKSSNID
jgi:hypothetical protein